MLFELENVSVARGGTTVIEGLSAELGEGATAVVGPSGVGKSSLLRLLNRLADPARGRILYRGAPLAGREVHELRREVALVPQLPALLDGTVADNLRFAAGLAGRELGDPREIGRAARAAAASTAPSPTGRAPSSRSESASARCLPGHSSTSPASCCSTSRPRRSTPPRPAAIERTLAELREEGGLSLVVVTHDPAQAERLGDSTLRIEPRVGRRARGDADARARGSEGRGGGS